MKKLIFSASLLALGFSVNAQTKEQQTKAKDSTKTEILDEVLVKSVRVDAD